MDTNISSMVNVIMSETIKNIFLPITNHPVVAFILFIVFLLFVFFKFFKGGIIKEEEAQIFPYYLKDKTMNDSEKSLFNILNRRLGDRFVVLSKVRIEDFIGVKREGISKSKHFGFRNKIKSRHVDFLICDKETTKPLMVVELDGASHRNTSRMTRDDNLDDMYKNINLKHKHVKVGSMFEKEVEEIKNNLDGVNE